AVAEVAGPSDGTGRDVVAGDPLLVEEERAQRGGEGRDNGRAPGQSVRRAADEQSGPVPGDRERHDEPGPVQRVVGDTRVADDGEVAAWGRVHSQAREEAAPPRAPGVERSREADVRRAAAEDPADLEDVHDGRPRGRVVGLDL